LSIRCASHRASVTCDRSHGGHAQEVGPVNTPHREQLSLFGPSVLVPEWSPPDALGGALAVLLICIPWMLIGWLIWMVA
jgi:hypothetical protein